MPDSASVSVIIPTCNVSATIERAVLSAITQTVPPLEIICVDDCSKDNTREILARLADTYPNVRVFHQPQNRGPSAARNIAIKEARGDWIAILDGDDAWRPERMEHMLAAAHTHGVDAVMDNIILHDLAAGVDVRLGYYPTWPYKHLSLADFLENSKVAQFQYSILQPIIRRQTIIDKALFYPEGQRYGEDLIYYAELLAGGVSFLLLPEGWYICSTRIGEASGKRNTNSQSQPDFAAIVTAIDNFIARHPQLSAEERQAAWSCRQSIHIGDKLNKARTAWRSGRKPEALLKLMDPRVPALMVRMRLRRKEVAREAAREAARLQA